MTDPHRPALNADNPWPGLDPFDEGDRKYFHGREDEISELLRLVRREPLTVLFGRSGLGKTSLLRRLLEHPKLLIGDALHKKCLRESVHPIHYLFRILDHTFPILEQE